MKKVFIYFFIFLLIFFLLPAFLTKRNVEAKGINNSTENENKVEDKLAEKEKFEETYVLISITFYTMDYDG